MAWCPTVLSRRSLRPPIPSLGIQDPQSPGLTRMAAAALTVVKVAQGVAEEPAERVRAVGKPVATGQRGATAKLCNSRCSQQGTELSQRYCSSHLCSSLHHCSSRTSATGYTRRA